MTPDLPTPADGSGESCGCPDFTLSRRRFLATTVAGAGVLTAGQLFDDAWRQVAYGAAPGGNVVVVVSLRGGSDGLSMVVPRGADHDLLAAARPGIVVPEATLIGGDTNFGLHPAFAPLLPMWNAGTFGAVHAVGLPAPNRSHFDAMIEVEDADPGSSGRVGWINRVVGLDASAQPEGAVQLGSALLPTSLVGPAPALGVRRVQDLSVPTLANDDAAIRRTSLGQMWARTSTPLGSSVRATLATAERLAPLVASADDVVHPTAYPAGPLREVLANTAALIRADVGTRMVTVDYGNWDMHNGLGQPDSGWMADQVTHLAGALAAFFTDLGAAASRVTVVTISEFGRRVQENGDHGVDHGYGNAMLLLGAGVNGGGVRGQWAHLNDLNDGDLAIRQDFRSVLWEVLASRFPEVSGSKATVFPGFVPETVGAMS
ncbi:DUF1501 domain-containing protein [Nocardioides guangzhouensis]|uniref:DUF1501 domain-containing protein n=1 Tax=Nocardioides guangzhouensis TaxID=2497878 RepID=A0A4Q4ZK63_9ACTN|nr:DUF1501 domain-containing protein [Nocardioides guangzhouensis]RYP88730.1 DUF1501 domain-containing protein [Nocardioides guangzhouensis]